MKTLNSLYGVFAISLLAMTGCSVVTSTTNVTADTAKTVSHGVSASSRASTDASVTEPDTPRHAEAEAFVTSQFAVLRVEAAAGGGEHVDALARLLNQEGDDLGRWMQAHYRALFSPNHSAETVVEQLATRPS